MAKKSSSGELKTGRLERLANLGTLTGMVGSSYLWSALKRPFQSEVRADADRLDTHLRNVMRIVESSKELRGAFMKLTQILSMRDDLFPTEALDVLSVVQSGVPPMDYGVIRSRIVEELGHPPETIFETFDTEAFAAASLGQVHRARLRSGEDVVVKVQYPGVEKTVKSDLENVKALIRALKLVASDLGGKRDLDWRGVYDELRERLSEELDYRLEAANAELFRALFADDPGVLVPAVHHELSTRRLITLGYVEGYRIKEIFAPGVDQELKDQVMVKLYEITWRQLLEFGVVHVDPHPGNYLVTHEPRIALLDYGCVRVLPPPLRDAYRDLNRALLEDDEILMRDALVRLDFLNPADDHRPMRKILRRLFDPVLKDRAVDPRKYDSIEQATLAAQDAIRAGYWKAPPHRVFLDRVMIGLDAYLKQSGTVTNWHRIWKKWVYTPPKDVTQLLSARSQTRRV